MAVVRARTCVMRVCRGPRDGGPGGGQVGPPGAAPDATRAAAEAGQPPGPRHHGPVGRRREHRERVVQGGDPGQQLGRRRAAKGHPLRLQVAVGRHDGGARRGRLCAQQRPGAGRQRGQVLVFLVVVHGSVEACGRPGRRRARRRSCCG